MEGDHLAARGYGWAYDRLVDGFGPWEALVGEVANLLALGATESATFPPLRVLDVACGTGSVARRLAARGHQVVGVDPVAYLVNIAREVTPSGATVFHHADVACDNIPGAGEFDALVSMHTYYWHPDPCRFLEGCRRALKPNGQAVFLTYARPVRPGADFLTIRRAEGLRSAIGALRWLVPTAVFEALRQGERRYVDPPRFTSALSAAGFHVLQSHCAFLADLSIVTHARRGRGTTNGTAVNGDADVAPAMLAPASAG